MSNPSKWSKIKTACQIALACYLITLVVATHLPPTSPILPNEHYDKFYHLTAYTLLAGLVATTWQLNAGVLNVCHLCWTWVTVTAFGALDEITQTPFGRDCSLRDWTADAVGALAGILLFAWLRKVIASRIAVHK